MPAYTVVTARISGPQVFRSYAEVKRLREGTGQFEVRLLDGRSPAPVSLEPPS